MPRTVIILLTILLIVVFWAGCTKRETREFWDKPTQEEVPRLIRQLNAKEPYKRVRAANLLGGVGPDAVEAVPVLIKVLKEDEEYQVRSVAAASLGVISKNEEVVAALIEAAKDENQSVRGNALISLGWVGPEPGVVSAVIDSLHDMDVRLYATNAIGMIGSEARDAVPSLIEMLYDDEWDIRSHAAEALGAIGPDAEEAVPALIETLGDEMPWVRLGVIDTLCKIGPPAFVALPKLREIAKSDPFQYKDGSYTVREAAEKAIAKIENSGIENEVQDTEI